MNEKGSPAEIQKLKAAVEFLRHLGAKQVQIRYSDEVEPTVWFVVIKFDESGALPVNALEVDAAFNPLRAALRLCERMADGGKCIHCGRAVGFEPDALHRMPLDEVICWYQYDPELKTFRRGCE